LIKLKARAVPESFAGKSQFWEGTEKLFGRKELGVGLGFQA